VTRMTSNQEDLRQSLEDSLSLLNDVDVCLRLIDTRTRFVAQRYGTSDNTQALHQEADKIRKNASLVRAVITELNDRLEQSGWQWPATDPTSERNQS
jgi:hypothetical protein